MSLRSRIASRRIALVPIAFRVALAAGLTAVVAVAPGWSDPGWASTAQGHHAAKPTKSASLSGKWSGNYSGSYSGTFKLTWQESGQKLSGTIEVSAFKNEPTSIHGTVQGASIRFGTVGSESITYAGSAKGSSMSGTWKIQAGGRSMGGGSWNASKSS
jgi:hypothetical protein